MFKSRRISLSESEKNTEDKFPYTKAWGNKPSLGETERATVNFRKSLTLSQILRNVFVCLIILIILSWLGLGLKRIILPPYLTILYPSDNLITEESLLKITGRTEKEAQIFINNQLVSYNKEGYFEETVSLGSGLNLIKISATRGDGRERVVWRRVMLNVSR